MISLEINGIEFKHFNNTKVNWRFDSIASTFSFELLFDPNNPTHRQVFKPGQYLTSIVKYNDNPIITGEILVYNFRSSSKSEPVKVSGYSKTGVLEDCEIPLSIYPLQVNGMNLYQITDKIASEFGLNVVIDGGASGEFSKRLSEKYDKVTASDNQRCNSYISELANLKQIILSHDSGGNILLTESKTNADPVFDFNSNIPGVEYELNFDGQRMHSVISMVRQASKSSKNAGQSELVNPIVKAYRPTVRRQWAGNNMNDTKHGVRNALSEELKSIELKIKIQGWELMKGELKPNSIITVENQELLLSKKSRWFLERIEFTGDSKQEYAVLYCYLPEVYNYDVVKNIFE